MSEKYGLQGCGHSVKDAVCIQTEKIYDACKDKDCLEDLRVYLTRCGREIIERAINVKVRKAEVIWIYTDVEAVPFNRGFYTVDLKYFFKITLDVFTGVGRPIMVEGLSTFDKKVILFGSEGNAKIFSSKYRPDDHDIQLAVKNNLPKAIVEVVDPIALGAKLVERRHCGDCCDNEMDISSIPAEIGRCFDDDFVGGESDKRVYVTIGVFTIIKLERNVQLLIPVYDFCVPEKECVGATNDDPCELFKRIQFPLDEFFPPNECKFEDDINAGPNTNCGCKR